MTVTAADAYSSRFRKVLEYIDAHLDEELSVDRLASVAAFSKFHFHRQFSELFGIGVSKYVQLLRLRRASYQLAFRDRRRIIDIALDSGYESHEAFARAFKRSTGQTPSEFREQPRWDPWHATYQILTELRTRHMKPESRAEDVQIVDFEETMIAVLEHTGDPRRIGDSVRRFIEWRKKNGLSPKTSRTFNILYNNPNETPPEEYRLDIGVSLAGPLAKSSDAILEKVIPGGRCAVLRHVGSDETLGDAVHYLYSTWLPQSGEEPRDYPLFIERVRFFPDVPAHEAVADIYLPIL